MRIALTGNPNSGKTTMYNALTGRNEKVGNWAGVTVDKKEHSIKKTYYAGGEQLSAVDLPGAYSMSPFTSEESITSSYVKKENPDVIINIVDATNLSRSLFFTTQLLELGIPVVVALNKSDINEKKETRIDTEALSEKLGCPVINTVSTAAEGLKAVIEAAVEQTDCFQKAPYTQGDIDLSDKAAVESADRKRFEFVNGIVKEVESRKVLTKDKNIGDKIDAVLTNRWLGIPIFAVVMFLVFQISQAWVGPYIADTLVGWLESFQGWVGGLCENASPLLSALLVDGVIGGVIAVIGFLPLVMVMYFLIALLEDCGYMSRVAVVLDPIFKKVGLSGKSVIPFVITIGCAVPGIMASRTIRNERERRATAMLSPFMPCGAKIPVIALFAGAFFDNAGWVSALMYLSGIVLIFLGALLVNKIVGYKIRKSFFIIELPEYKIPSLLGALKSMCSRGWAYIVKAATIILLCNTAVQIMQTFDWSFRLAKTADASILASIASPFAYLLVPIVGVLSWQLAAAAVTGFIAKENVVGTLAVCFVGLENLIDTEELALMEGAGAEVAGVMAITKVAALAYLMFNLYTPPCFAAIGAMNSEMTDAACSTAEHTSTGNGDIQKRGLNRLETIKIKYFTDKIDKLAYIDGKSDWIDLRAAEDVDLKKGEFKLIPLGVAMELPAGYEAHVVPRSSTFKNFGIIQTNHQGVIDSSYCGDHDQWFMPVYAVRDTQIHVNDRICQFRIMENQPKLIFDEVEKLDHDDRGGHGSTGKQ